MDKLPESKKAEVKKMSDTRLISKLLQSGYSSEQIDVMNNYFCPRVNEHVGRSNCVRQRGQHRGRS